MSSRRKFLFIYFFVKSSTLMNERHLNKKKKKKKSVNQVEYSYCTPVIFHSTDRGRLTFKILGATSKANSPLLWLEKITVVR